MQDFRQYEVFKKHANFSYLNFTQEEKNQLIFNIDKPTFSWQFGKYSSALRLGNNKIYKLCHFVNIDNELNIKKQKYINENYLVTNASELAKAIEKYQIERTDTYNTLGKYIGDFLPKRYSTNIVQVPRRFLANLKYSRTHENPPKQELLEQIPIKELNVAELWDSLGLFSDLSTFKFEQLQDLYNSKSFKQQVSLLVTGLEGLLNEKGLMVDIINVNGLRFKTLNNVNHSSNDIDKINKFLKSGKDQLPFFLNSSYENNKLYIYDTFPIFKSENTNLLEIYKLVLEYFKS